ncbi:SCF ubiquitin ligase complex subunit SAF1 [Cyberlindnera jadinii NRRL Y-1542]|uniref:RCC1/BLIP-II protein n=1 Tax=Cyberlindnera jadinii (strain ATCC 18201 / CBS 1600 / BCRC 20928 / JCM 3617 / NBRC 0987 / NRRL Y-1542) TaxID=983966 RepID=A0A1E4RW88_CYBJN|nr:RCC1/BLIP-II protein [Cyberlindnera jadinii NRRL Y-1542]ODV71534.1 RCC1/BLIP-II protein [Cyberlindnera jadinii NRRL Y-1542]
MVQFADLPQDVLETFIYFLSPEDITSLKLTSKSLYYQISNSSYVWQQLYYKTFGSKPTPYSLNKWSELYEKRSKGRLYCWGSMVGGRLGFNSSDIPRDHVSRSAFRTGVPVPTLVPKLDTFVLADVSAGGFSHQLLTSAGEIYSLGSWHSGHRSVGPDSADYEVTQQHAEPTRTLYEGGSGVPFPPDLAARLRRARPLITGRRGGGRINDPTILPFPLTSTSPVHQEASTTRTDTANRFLNHEHAPQKGSNVKFISISSGRCHFIALDNTGNVWSWDNPRTGYGINIQFFDESGNNIIDKGHKVLRCHAGWNSTAAYLYGYGLVYWEKRSALEEGKPYAVAHHTLVPNTGMINGEDKVIDFMVGDGYLVYLTQRGELFRNDMIGMESYPLTKFSKVLVENCDTTEPKFVRLSGNFNTFACFTNDDLVFLGSKDGDEPELVQELKHKNCISVAVGDYHLLALCNDGSLYSWGLESAGCGCLGLGTDPQGSEREDRGSIRVRKPTLVETEGKVIAIAAAGWHSSAIVIKDD